PRGWCAFVRLGTGIPTREIFVARVLRDSEAIPIATAKRLRTSKNGKRGREGQTGVRCRCCRDI
ncbi:MAG: hypothetical protein ACK56I_30590, partial [bacterium]